MINNLDKTRRDDANMLTASALTLVLAIAGLFMFGILSLTMNLFVAIGISLLVVAAVGILRPAGNVPVSVMIGAVGLVLFLVGDVIASFTLADALGGGSS